MYITHLSPEYFENLGMNRITAVLAFKRTVRLFLTDKKLTDVEVYIGPSVFRIANDLGQAGKMTNFNIFKINDFIIGTHFKGGENMSEDNRTLEQKQKDLEDMVKNQNLTENLSEVAMPGVTRVLENPQPAKENEKK